MSVMLTCTEAVASWLWAEAQGAGPPYKTWETVGAEWKSHYRRRAQSLLLVVSAARTCWACEVCPEVMAATHQWADAVPECAVSVVMGTEHEPRSMVRAVVSLVGDDA